MASAKPPSAARDLAPSQAHALFDILTHHQLYSEIQGFKWPDAIQDYGPPFTSNPAARPSSPIMSMMLNKIVVKMPGMRTLPPDFWQERVKAIVANLGEAELSESYDKGSMGSRKTLATASAVWMENLARGMLGGCPRVDARDGEHYDKTQAEDLERAWEQAASDLVYGDLISELFDGAAKSDKLEDTSPVVQAAIEHILIIAASLMHHIFVLSPDGQYLLRLLGNINKLVPYMAIKQTLRVGNAATMINGMLKLLLTKVSLNAVTNWMGISKNADDGMNLLQQIISTVLSWDNSEFESITSNIRKDKDETGPDPTLFDAIDKHTSTSRERHEKLRAQSQAQQKSIVAVIIESQATNDKITEISEDHHTLLLQYFAASLSIRDRKELIRVLCQTYPDNLTQSIKDMVSVYDPLIRSIHQGVDLSSFMGDLQNFVDELIKLVRPNPKSKSSTESEKGSGGKSPSSPKFKGLEPPSVEGFLDLIKKYIPVAFRFLHQVAKNCPDVREEWRGWANETIKNFRMHNSSKSDNNFHQGAGAGALTPQLNHIFSSMDDSKKASVTEALDEHATYLTHLSNLSTHRAQSILDTKKNKNTLYGPGIYLSRWHNLLDNTLITPATLSGPLRKGRDVQFKDEEGKVRVKEGKGKEEDGWWDREAVVKDLEEEERESGVDESQSECPDVSVVVEAFEEGWRGLLGGEGR